jgi:hypothetical protein
MYRQHTPSVARQFPSLPPHPQHRCILHVQVRILAWSALVVLYGEPG